MAISSSSTCLMAMVAVLAVGALELPRPDDTVVPRKDEPATRR